MSGVDTWTLESNQRWERTEDSGPVEENQERLVLEKPLSRRMFLGGTKGNAIGKL